MYNVIPDNFLYQTVPNYPYIGIKLRFDDIATKFKSIIVFRVPLLDLLIQLNILKIKVFFMGLNVYKPRKPGKGKLILYYGYFRIID